MLPRKLLIVWPKGWASRVKLVLTRETPLKAAEYKYDPLNYDRMYADEYGNYGNIPGSSRPFRDGRDGGFGNQGGGFGGNMNQGGFGIPSDMGKRLGGGQWPN